MTAHFLTVTAFLCHGQTDAPTAEEVLQLAMKQRQAITQASGTFHFALEEPGAKSPTLKREIKIWRDRIQLRNDIGNKVQCLNCEKEGEYIEFVNARSETFMVVLTYNKIAPGSGERRLFLTDPRVIGLQIVQDGLLYSHSIDTIIGTADRTPPEMEKGKWNGYDCYIVRFAFKSRPQIHHAYTIVPSMDHSVVSIKTENKEFKAVLTLETEMDRFGKPGTWFPKSYVAQAVVDGKLSWRETMHAKDLTLNEPLDPNAFRLAGMNIPIGWTIKGSALPDRMKLYQWDGKRVIEVEQPKRKDRPKKTAEVSTPRSPSALVGIGAVLAVVGALALGSYYWKR